MSSADLKKKLKLKKGFNGEWILPENLTGKARELLEHVIKNFGSLINVNETINLQDLAKRMQEHYDNEKVNDVAKQLNQVQALTLVVYDGDHRDINKTDYQHTVVGHGDEEELIDQIAENEMAKSKYQDGTARRVGIYTTQGGELKGGIYQNDHMKPVPKRTLSDEQKLQYK